MWLEMSRNVEHGGPGWGFAECLWSPSHRNPEGTWPFWQLLLQVRKGDIVVHLRGKTHQAAFVGYSIADANGFETRVRPPQPREWGHAASYYRVPLTGYVAFPDPLKLDTVFRDSNQELREYFKQNKAPRDQKERLFFVIQAGRLQCLNGAYLSELNDQLAAIILGPDFSGRPNQPRPSGITARTGEHIAQIRARVGQPLFSENVRKNYGNRCCFPDCQVSDREFLVGAHIARWSDAPDLRGQTANGLCLCLFHDKAFELGLFTLTSDFRISVRSNDGSACTWALSTLIRFEGRLLRLGAVSPSRQALEYHWSRIGVRLGQAVEPEAP